MAASLFLIFASISVLNVVYTLDLNGGSLELTRFHGYRVDDPNKNPDSLYDWGIWTRGFVCKQSSGLFPDPKDCSKYYECKYYVARHRQCQKKYLFDSKTSKCQPEKKVNCKVEVPFTCPFPHGAFSHPKDCSKFYLCVFGRHSEKKCPKSELFHLFWRQCRNKNNVDCGDRENPYEEKTTKLPRTIAPTTPQMITTRRPWTDSDEVTDSGEVTDSSEVTSSEENTGPVKPTTVSFESTSPEERPSTEPVEETTVSESVTSTDQDKITTESDREVSTTSEELTTEGDVAVSTQGEINTGEPEASTQGEINTGEPEASTQGEINTGGPEVSTQGEINTGEPEASTREDEVTTGESEASTREDEVTTNEEELTTEGEQETSTQEEITTQGEPEVSTEGEVVTESIQPEETTTESSEPDITDVTEAETSTVEDTTTEEPTMSPECIIPDNRDVSRWFTCPESTEFKFPHPRCKNLFIDCVDGKPLIKKCAEELIFSEEYQTCVWDI